MSRFVEGQDRQQVTLLPECLDDFIGEDVEPSASAHADCRHAYPHLLKWTLGHDCSWPVTALDRRQLPTLQQTGTIVL